MHRPFSSAKQIFRKLTNKSLNSPSQKQSVSHLPTAPSNFDPETFFQSIKWYQRWEIFSGVFTPGINPIFEICERMGLPGDLSGRRVLDIGSDNGCMSLECERRGAAEVVGLTPRLGPEWGHDQLRDLVGATKTSFREGSVYDLDPEVLGYFDTVLFCGVLYHLRYPMFAIDNIRRVATGDLFIETHISDDTLHERDRSTPLWKFYRHSELNNDCSNWFGPNVAAVTEAFESAGFSTQMVFTNGARASFKATVKDGLPEFLTIRSFEARTYDVLLKRLFGNKENWNRSNKPE
jgi:tRNA (mo5U34)-methyltransferase